MHTSFLLACHERDPKNVKVAVDLADRMIEEAAHLAALRLLQNLPAHSLVSTDVQFRIARCALAVGNTEMAIDQYRALLKDGYRQLPAECGLAYALQCAERPGEALSVISSAIKYFGANRELLILEARGHLLTGEYVDATNSADAALALDENDATALGIKALSLFDGGNTETAWNTALRALELDSEQYEAMLVSSTVLLWKREVAEAEVLLERLYVAHPKSGRVLSGRGDLAMIKHDWKAAESSYIGATLAMPNQLGAWHALAWAQLMQGDREAAFKSFQAAYEINRNFGETHAGLAIILTIQGDFQGAHESVERARKLGASGFTAACAAALLCRSRGEFEAADAHMSRLLGSLGRPAAVSPDAFLDRLVDLLSESKKLS